jgi:hypothetical protein
MKCTFKLLHGIQNLTKPHSKHQQGTFLLFEFISHFEIVFQMTFFFLRDIAMRFVWWSPYRSHPDTLSFVHLPRMLASNALFARKFNIYNLKFYQTVNNLLDIAEQEEKKRS